MKNLFQLFKVKLSLNIFFFLRTFSHLWSKGHTRTSWDWRGSDNAAPARRRWPSGTHHSGNTRERESRDKSCRWANPAMYYTKNWVKVGTGTGLGLKTMSERKKKCETVEKREEERLNKRMWKLFPDILINTGAKWRIWAIWKKKKGKKCRKKMFKEKFT